MVTFLVRFTALALGLIFAWLALSSWRSGEPPVWTTFLTPEPARVLASGIEAGRIASGVERSTPVVTVEWPLGSGQAYTLAGLQPAFFAYRRDEAEAIAAEFAVGNEVGVRVLDGKPYADRLDLFRLLHAAGMTLLAAALLVVGLIMAVAGCQRCLARKPR